MEAHIDQLVSDIRHAAGRLDREEVAALCRRLIAEARRRRLPDKAGVDVLKVLQRKRYFDLLQSVAEVLIETNQATLEVRRRRVQSLIDQKDPRRAVREAEQLVPDTVGDQRENPEARGLLGRALKQIYIDACRKRQKGDPVVLGRAVRVYSDAYFEDPKERLWHGVNTVALLARAQRDRVEVPDVGETYSQIARALLQEVERKDAFMSIWDMATALEACVALGKKDGAVRWANGYAAHPGADAFELGSTLRQMEEVWELKASSEMGAAVLPILRNALLRREEGGIDLTPAELRNELEPEAILGRDSYVSLAWYRRGLDRARAVGRISRSEVGNAVGTGFLVKGRTLAPTLPDEWLLLTNYHVVNTDQADFEAVRPGAARVSFFALGPDEGRRRYAMHPVPVWSSEQLDATLLRLQEVPVGVQELPPLDLAPETPPVPDKHARVYVIGHPLGEVLSLSIHDNRLLGCRDYRLHYRAPTEQGSSGSPVFNAEWALLALHRAGGKDGVEKLDRSGTYAANEGIWIQSIRRAIGGEPPPRRAAPLTSPPLHPSSRETRDMDGIERIKEKVREIEARDPELGSEMERRRGEAREEARITAEGLVSEGIARSATGALGLAEETIVLRTGRPVLRIANDAAVLEFSERDSRTWKDRLTRAQRRLQRSIRAVGRVEVEGHPEYAWLGTAVQVAEDVVATNRHVAAKFGQRRGQGFVFQRGLGGRDMSAAIDYVEEVDRDTNRPCRVVRILHIEGPDGPDLALLQVEPNGSTLPPCVALAEHTPRAEDYVAVIGYPARDSRIPDQALMESIFGNVYDKKRLAPGQVTGMEDGSVLHDCSTLGGNSGSGVFDLETGNVLAIHFAGTFLKTNYAVPARVLADRLRAVGRTPCRDRSVPSRPRDDAPRPDHGGTTTITVDVGGTTVTIPIEVTVTIGAPSPGDGSSPHPGGGEGDEDPVLVEGRPEDYDDRPGYEPGFLGSGFTVPLPTVGRRLRNDVLTFGTNGKDESELRYQHFSVVMSRSRRLCLFSAVNIDGGQSVKRKRVGWRLDPRIPEAAQIRGECYGNPPKYSRGHMTRREDPVWGDGADLGNEDSMHVTNAVPQMQPFNAGIWLGLEDYALDNARGDDMRISVFTGPILRDDDPEEFGVRIPRSFWKVIAFIHDETGKLSATGYWMSQEKEMSDREFVFGEHGTSQRPIRWIEEQTGLSFGPLADADPMRDAEEALPLPLTRFQEIRFV